MSAYTHRVWDTEGAEMGVFRIIALIALLGIPSAAVAQFHAAPEMHTGAKRETG